MNTSCIYELINSPPLNLTRQNRGLSGGDTLEKEEIGKCVSEAEGREFIYARSSPPVPFGLCVCVLTRLFLFL